MGESKVFAFCPASVCIPWSDPNLYSAMISVNARVPEHGAGADRLFRGFGTAVAKSLELFWVSVQPFEPRSAAVVLPGAGVGPTPLKQFAVLPYPTSSTIVASLGQAPVRAVEVLTRATLPAEAAMAVVPVTSGAGSSAPLLPPDAS